MDNRHLLARFFLVGSLCGALGGALAIVLYLCNVINVGAEFNVGSWGDFWGLGTHRDTWLLVLYCGIGAFAGALFGGLAGLIFGLVERRRGLPRRLTPVTVLIGVLVGWVGIGLAAQVLPGARWDVQSLVRLIASSDSMSWNIFGAIGGAIGGLIGGWWLGRILREAQDTTVTMERS